MLQKAIKISKNLSTNFFVKHTIFFDMFYFVSKILIGGSMVRIFKGKVGLGGDCKESI